MDHFDTTTSTGSVAAAAEETSFDFSALDDAIVETIEKKALYFVPDIAAHLGIQSGLAFERLTELVKEGRVDVSEKNGDRPQSYYVALREVGHVESERDVAADHSKAIGRMPAAGDPGFDKLTEVEIEERVLAAIDGDYRSYVGIKRQIGAPAAFDLSDVLDQMCGDYVLRKHPAGAIVAFFRYETMPLSVKLVGDGRVDAVFDPDFVPRDEKKKQAELAGMKIPADDDDPLELDGPKPKPGRQRREIDEDELEEAAATEANFEAVAEKLGVSTSVLQSRIAESPLLKSALSEGIGRNSSYTASTKPAPKPADDERGGTHESPAAPSSAERTENIDVLSERYVEELATEDPDVASIARRAGKTVAYVEAYLNDHPTVKKAWKRGRAMYEQSQKSMEAKTAGAGQATTRTARKSKADAITEAALKKAAETLPNLHEIAGSFGIGQPAFSRALKNRPELKKVYEDARERYFAENPRVKSGVKGVADKPVARRSSAKGGSRAVTIDKVKLKELAKTCANDKAIAEGLGIGVSTLSAKCSTNPKLRKIIKAGRRVYKKNQKSGKAADQPAVDAIRASMETPRPKANPITGIVPSTIGMDLDEEEVAGQKTHATGHIVVPQASTAEIPLGTGRIAVAIDANLFETSREERDRLNDFIDAVQLLTAKKLND